MGAIVRVRTAVLGIVTGLVVVSGMTSPHAAAASGPLTRSNYNSSATGGRADPYWRVQAKSDDRVAYVPDPLGQRGVVQRIGVQPGDRGVHGSIQSERAEVVRPTDLGGFVDGQTIVMSWSTMIDSNFASPPGDWNNFVQIHVHSGLGGQSPWQLNLRGDAAELRMRLYGGGTWDGKVQPSGSIPEWFDLGPFVKNQWHDFVAAVRFGCTGEGFARVWMDGKQLVDAVHRKIGYCGDPGLYWKQGFYRVAYDKPTQLWFADTFRWTNAAEALAHYGWVGHR